jgi:hypothetical protein
MKKLPALSLVAIEHILEQDPLLAIDRLIQSTRDAGEVTSEQELLIDYALRAILSIAGVTHVEDRSIRDLARAVLDDLPGLQKKQLIAACFLRLLPENGMQWLTDTPWRPRVINLLDHCLSHDVYPIYRIDEGLQAHEKISPLIEATRSYQGELRRALLSLTSLELLKRHRQSTMKALNSKMGRFLVHPFLMENIEARLDELYTRVQNYIEQRENLGVVDAHERAMEEIQQFIDHTVEKGSIYSLWFSELLGNRLLTLVGTDFASNKAAQPAQLTVRAIEKKYPFHLVNHTVRLGFVISNLGPGYAHHTSIVLAVDDNLGLIEEEVDFGRLAPSREQRIEVPVKVLKATQEADILLVANWQNYDGTPSSTEFVFMVSAQQSDIDWDALSKSDPYSLEPVTTEQELVGRRDVLDRLIATTGAASTGSSVIFGQKRVGKTSVARTLQSHLEASKFMVVFLEGGDYVQPSARATVAGLGEMLATKLPRLDQRISHLQAPSFDEALSPLAKLLDEVSDIIPDRRLIIILDEFDELPASLYARGPLGDAFFLTLRSISSRPILGIVIVGGEKMRNIMDSQGDQLNKWNVIAVDYFNRETDWADYRELVQRPVFSKLEYTEDALVALHEFTAGNPYFTKLICQNVFRTAIEQRDCHITAAEIHEAVKATVNEVKSNTFQHFWEDGILELGDQGKEKSVRRRKILIAVSDSLQKQAPAPKQLIASHKLVHDLHSLESELREFVSRQVLISSPDNEAYDFKVRLFQEWLKGRGVQDVITEFADIDEALRTRQKEEELKVKSSEIVVLADKWRTYQGQAITEDKIRAWLEQFGSTQERRLMFTVLSHLRFYSDDFLRRKMAEIHGIVERGLTRYLERLKSKRSDILVGYLDSPSKSGAHFARLYADEAKIYVGNIVEKSQLAEALQQEPIRALVFVDDFVCTGNSVVENLQELDSQLAKVVLERDIKVVFVAAVAFKQGWQRIEELVENELVMPVITRYCELLGEEAQCFGDSSDCFTHVDIREDAKRTAAQYGRSLEKKWPLGYGNFGLAVVFERSCPNNSLPILWKESTTWIPLFKRH